MRTTKLLQGSWLLLYIAIYVLRQCHLIIVTLLNSLASYGRIFTVIGLISIRRGFYLLRDAPEPFISPPGGLRLLLGPANFLLDG